MMIDPRDNIAMGKQLIKLLTDNELRNQLKRWQGLRVKDFDIATVGPELEKIYHKAIKQRVGHDSKHKNR